MKFIISTLINFFFLHLNLELTYFRNTWSSLCFWGFTVASNSGRKIFSSILAKLGINLRDLKMSLKEISIIAIVKQDMNTLGNCMINVATYYILGT